MMQRDSNTDYHLPRPLSLVFSRGDLSVLFSLGCDLHTGTPPPPPKVSYYTTNDRP